jgi:polyribonucleotide nucleotidyltransferase
MSRQHEFVARCTVGDVFDGTVERVEPYGAFVEIVDGGHGFLHVSEWKPEWQGRPEPGTRVRVRVVDIDAPQGRMSVRLV